MNSPWRRPLHPAKWAIKGIVNHYELGWYRDEQSFLDGMIFLFFKEDLYMEQYNHKTIEKKWQDYWYENQQFKAIDFDQRPKFYGLIEFPYPSGAGMHVGHIRAFSSIEIIARKRRMEGFNVLFPIGFDAFGLPTENYAIKTGIHPRIVTDQNILTFTRQLKSAGFSFDFSRTVDTTQPEYYHWTQWIFLQLFKKGYAYKSTTYVNYCPSCKVVLANEEAQGGHCDRCDSLVEQKEKDVWFLKISAYAESLLKGLDDVEYLPRVKTEQVNWIGKSLGAEVRFNIEQTEDVITVFTTRPDTLFGATFMVIAPEHPLINKLKNHIVNQDEIERYREETRKKSEFERVQLVKEKTGVHIQGINAINPLTKKAIPIFIADYVMMGYGTGAIMAVPGHDDRDYDFAKKFHLDIVEVIQGGNLEQGPYTDTENGILIHSGFLDGLKVEDAKIKMIEFLEDNHIGTKAINYKMKDWAFNRQRYWGEPIPIIHCPHCGQVPVPEDQLPVVLPDIKNFEPGENGESPLAKLEDWINVKCPICHEDARRETDTMPQWAGSSWYFLRYSDPHNSKALASRDAMNYWLPVDWYNGGMEHVTRHMIYSRFWNQFLFDQGVVPYKEPYKKRTTQGLILGSDGEKMSKSRGNVVDPLGIIEEYGADTLRTYILFIGEYEQPTPWNEQGIKGCRRFIERVYRFLEKVRPGDSYTPALVKSIHKAIKDVSSDIENSKFNTAISKLMTLSNEYGKQEYLTQADVETLIKLMYPFTPHFCEEMHELLGHKTSLVYAPWPTYQEDLTHDDEVEVAVQVNGKLRGTFIVAKDSPQSLLESMALNLESVQVHTRGKTIKKVIVVPNKIVNIVVQ